jgi:benzoyl-CoA-dihydrodiol lyase
VATLAAISTKNAGLRPGYKLKLNSYDLGVDIELNDADQPHPLRAPRGAHRGGHQRQGEGVLLGRQHLHAGRLQPRWKVNFCKFTNETRNGLEDSSQYSGLKFLAAVNGACAGGGYELALACDEIILVDDRSSAVSLPEVPLLGVLPGTGGLTRVTDKRRCATTWPTSSAPPPKGVRGQKAKDWRLVDDIAKPAQFAAKVQERALQLAAASDRPAECQGRALTPLAHRGRADALRYAACDGGDRPRQAHRHLHRGPARRARSPPTSPGIEAAGAAWYPLADGAASWKTPSCRCAPTSWTSAPGSSRPRATPPPCWRWTPRCWRTRTTGWCARPSACCAAPSAAWMCQPQPVCADRAGLVLCRQLLELALACDRSYQLMLPDDAAKRRRSRWRTNFGLYPMATGQSRLGRRFYDEASPALEAVRAAHRPAAGRRRRVRAGPGHQQPGRHRLGRRGAHRVEERVAMSPDALTGMEANLRFNGPENMFTRVFGRLTAWQNWIFQRPNAVGEKGALKVYGKGDKAAFDWNRV